MPEIAAPQDFAGWLDVVRSRFLAESPDLLQLFDTYAAEAQFGRDYIGPELQQLRAGAKVLEVGAGSLLLSCQLVREGYDVTALEPTGEGFSHFERMRSIVMDQALKDGCRPVLLEVAGEELAQHQWYDLAFSVNVMEHVRDPATVLARVVASLRPGGRYRFTCPNYLFPYEPHFNMPTLISKQLTQRLMRARIFDSGRVTDPAGTWASLNWLTVPQVKRFALRLQGCDVVFNRSMLVSTLERVVSDHSFAARRSHAMRVVLGMLVKMRLHVVCGLVPAALQPIMDCCIHKKTAGEGRP